MAKSVTKEEIKHIASLAKLSFSDSELAKFENEFNEILSYVSKIQECDVSGIEFEHNMQEFIGDILQEDTVKPSLSREKVLQNATKNRNNGKYIRTSKIVNKE
jgi:aspartyl-tRNA(Asn)/glutamyl-tRNA(Gln) amidotransferase subunit C